MNWPDNLILPVELNLPELARLVPNNLSSPKDLNLSKLNCPVDLNSPQDLNLPGLNLLTQQIDFVKLFEFDQELNLLSELTR